MKAILEFNLPEEQGEFELASQAGSIWCVIWELNQFLRSKLKYESEKYTEEQLKIYSEIREKLFELREQNNVLKDY